MRLDPELSSALRKVKIDFMNRLDVYRKRPTSLGNGQGLSRHPNEMGRREQRRGQATRELVKIVRKRIQTLGPCIDGTFRFILSDALMWNPRTSCATGRKILFLDASRAHCQAEATSEMAIELPPEEQVKGEDLIGELLKSLCGTRRAAHNWEKRWQRVIIDSGFVIGTWSPESVCCRERELSGFVHGDDFIITGDSMQLAWIESRL